MLFVSTFLVGLGYTLLYAAVKGDKYQIAGTPVYRRPWLPLVNALAGGALGANMNPNAPGISGAVTAAAGGASTGSSSQQPAPPPAKHSSGGFDIPFIGSLPSFGSSILGIGDLGGLL